MVDVLEEWLSSTIQKDLGKVLEHASQHAQPIENPFYEDDGSNLRAQCSKPGLVQIVKFETSEETVQVAISDSIIKINATISSAAVEEFRQRARRRVTDKILGNLIQLNDADIVATHFGPRNKRITMYIKSFKVVGSDNSPQVGIPLWIGRIPEIRQLQESLLFFRRREEGSIAGDPARKSPISQRQARDSFSDNSKESQQLFSQIPLQSRILTSPSEKKKLVGLKLPLNAVSSSLNPQVLSETKRPPLEFLIKAKNSRKQLKPIEAEVPPYRPKAKEEGITVESPSTPSKTPNPFATLESQPGSFGASASGLIDDMQGPNSMRDEASVISLSPKPSSIVTKRQKIKTRNIRIPKDQENLLSREDSWLPAEPGQRGPVTNIPISNLQAINRHVERRMRKPTSPEGTSPRRESSQDISASRSTRQVSEAGSPTEALSWSSSPPIEGPQNQFAPDSNLASRSSSDQPQSIKIRQDDQSTPPKITHNVSIYDRDTIRRPQSLESQSSPTGEASSVLPDSLDIQASDNPGECKINESQKQESEVKNADSDSEPELETLVPLQLVERKEDAPSQNVPFTSAKSILQVKRTPYVKNDKRNPLFNEVENYLPSGHYLSPSKRRRLSMTGVNEIKGTVDIPTAATQNSWLLNDADPRSDKTSNSPTQILCSVTEETELTGPNQPVPSGVSLSQEEVNIERNSSASPVPLSNASERQKKKRGFLHPKITQVQQNLEDPSVMARRYRQEFLASKDSFLSENPVSDVRQEIPNTERSPENKQSKDASRTPCTFSNQITKGGTNNMLSQSKDAKEPASSFSEVIFEISHTGQLEDHFGILRAVPSSTISSTVRPESPIVPSIEKSESSLQQTVNSDIHAVERKFESISPASNTRSRGNSKQNDDPQQSGLAQSLPSLMTPALSVIDMAPQTTTDQNFDFSPGPCSPMTPDSIFSQFQITYPSYTGNLQHFTAMCRRIKHLIRVDRMEHKSLWDDFIARHKTDYPGYLQRCAEAVEEHKQYEQFYRDEIEEPMYTKRVITPQILHAMLSSSQSEEPEQVQPLTGPEGPSTSGTRQPPSRFQTVDLTIDDDDYLLPATSLQHAERAGSSTSLSPRTSPQYRNSFKTSKGLSSKHNSSTAGGNSFGYQLQQVGQSAKDTRGKANSQTSQTSRKVIQSSKSGKPELGITRLPASQECSRDQNIVHKPARLPVSDSRQSRKPHRPPPNTTNPSCVQVGEETDEWWKDDSTPFAQFARAYASIQPGKGNSFAQAELSKKPKSKVRNQEKQTDAEEEEPERIDVMAWHL